MLGIIHHCPYANKSLREATELVELCSKHKQVFAS